MIDIFMVERGLLSRVEVFDEADLDAALARFEELHRPTQGLENAATQVTERFLAHFAARNWMAVAEILADDSCIDDRRRVVNAGFWGGRDVVIANMRALDEGGANITWTVIATRGDRLALTRILSSNRNPRHGEFGVEMLGIAEINSDERFAAHVLFDLDDINAAFDELDARYLAGEAAAHSHAWSVISRLYAGFNRHELPATTRDWTYVDHRPLITVEARDLPASIRAIWDLTPDIGIYMEAVHRLSDVGAVMTHTSRGISNQDFVAEWRLIAIFTVDGELINRCEMFDEADLEAALARFDELNRQVPLLENVATRTFARVADAFNRRDMDGLLALSNADGRYEDRRKGLRDVLEGPARRRAVHTMFETFPSSWRMEVEPIAIRGSRHSLIHEKYRDIDDADRPTLVELLRVIEVSDDDLMRDNVSFDPDDIREAFAELTARWIASGDVAYPEVVEAVDRINATIDRHDWDAIDALSTGATYVNHRQLASPDVHTIADFVSSSRAVTSLIPDFWFELAQILAHSAMGVVAHEVLKGTSTDGVAIEIPLVVLILFDGDRVTRLEVFDADQRDMALARFGEFSVKSQPQ
jgi:hypothetical protein